MVWLLCGGKYRDQVTICWTAEETCQVKRSTPMSGCWEAYQNVLTHYPEPSSADETNFFHQLIKIQDNESKHASSNSQQHWRQDVSFPCTCMHVGRQEVSQLCLLSESKVLITKARNNYYMSNKDSQKVSWTSKWNGWLIILFKDSNGLKLIHEQIQADARRLKHTHTNCHAQIWVDLGK